MTRWGIVGGRPSRRRAPADGRPQPPLRLVQLGVGGVGLGRLRRVGVRVFVAAERLARARPARQGEDVAGDCVQGGVALVGGVLGAGGEEERARALCAQVGDRGRRRRRAARFQGGIVRGQGFGELGAGEVAGRRARWLRPAAGTPPAQPPSVRGVAAPRPRARSPAICPPADARIGGRRHRRARRARANRRMSPPPPARASLPSFPTSFLANWASPRASNLLKSVVG